MLLHRTSVAWWSVSRFSVVVGRVCVDGGLAIMPIHASLRGKMIQLTKYGLGDLMARENNHIIFI
jgi:hypothetical protein